MSILSTHKIDFKILDRPDVPTRRYAAGEKIIIAGSPPTEMYVLRRGKVAISVHGNMVEEIEPGGIFGEMALIDRSPRSATATAVVDCEVVPIDERIFVILVQDAPYFALDVMRVLVERLRAMNARL
jgi:CRP-like cAMP-binding protein